MRSNFYGPVNIGSEEMVSINELVSIVSSVANKKISINHIDGPIGVNGRNSDNRLIKKKLSWEPSLSLEDGISKTYSWILDQIQKN